MYTVGERSGGGRLRLVQWVWVGVQVLCNYNLCDKSSYKTLQYKVLLSELTLKHRSDNSDNIGAIVAA